MDGDPRTDGSIPAASAEDAQVPSDADIVIAGVRQGLSPTALGAMLVTAGRSIADEDDLLTLLQRVTEIARQAIDGADSVGVTIDLGGRAYSAVHTDRRTLRVDSDQYDAGEGPCLHAARTRSIVLVDAGDAVQRWPEFAAAARDEGILSFLAAPLFTAEQTLGSFNLYAAKPSAFDAVDAEILDMLTATVSRAIGDFARFKSARDVADSIQLALQTRAPIEQAKGVLMAIHNVDADAAFDLLRRESQATNIPVRTVAANLLRRLSGTTTPTTTDGAEVS
jgi:GAF domain-containing protein